MGNHERVAAAPRTRRIDRSLPRRHQEWRDARRGRNPIDEGVGRDDVGRVPRQNDERGAMDLIGGHAAVAQIGVIAGRRGVGEEDDLEVAEERIPRGGVTTVLRRDSRNDDRGHAQTAQDDFQIRAIKGAEAVFLDDDLAIVRRDLGEDGGTG